MKRILGLISIAAVLTGAVASGADWRQFRGNATSSVAPGAKLPTQWQEGRNIAWWAALPGRGLSGPIVVGDRVYLTASSGPRQERLHVLCFAAIDGRQLWERQFRATGMTASHNKTCVAAPTPASDGARIFAFYSSSDLACLDLDGNLLWYRGVNIDFPNAANSLGMASSPVVLDGTVVVQAESDSDAVALGIDVATGENRWTLARPRKATWTSPLVFEPPSGEPLVVLQSSDGLTAVRPRTGETVWKYESGASTISSSTAFQDRVFAVSGGVTALKPGGGAAPDVLWKDARLGPFTISPLVHRGRIYSVNSAGVLSCADVASGSIAWRLRLKGPFASSPIAAGEYLYLFNEEGLGQVVRLGDDEGELVSENPLSDTILATPAVADDALYIRSDARLWKIAGSN